MAEKNRAELKSYFEIGDRPTQEQFADLIDSVVNKQDDGVNVDMGNFEVFNYVRVDAWNFVSRPPGWYRIASVTGDKRANAIFELREQADHSSVVFRVGCSFSDLNGTSVTVLSHNRFGTAVFQQLRLLTNGAYDEMYLEAYIEPHIHDDEPFWAIIKDNMRNGGWTLVNFTSGEIPAGYTETVYDIDELFVVAGSGDSESFRVDRYGNVGIGTDTPLEKLEVDGNILTSAGSGGTLALYETDATRRNRMVLGSDADGAYITSGYNTGGTGTIAFRPLGNQVMTITSNDVGIGTDTPEARLHIRNGDLIIQSSPGAGSDPSLILMDDAGTAQWRIYTDESQGNRLSFLDDINDQERMVIQQNGYVGIGTDSPQADLDVVSDGIATLRIQGNTSENTYRSRLLLDRTADARGGGVWITASEVVEPDWYMGVPYVGGSAAHDFFAIGFDANPELLENARMVIRGDSGYVGIGTAHPDAELEVTGTPDNAAVILSDASLIGFKRADSSLVYGIGHTNGEFTVGRTDNLGPSAGTPVNIATGNPEIKFTQGTEERMRIDVGGNVGIDTDLPGAKLDVRGDLRLGDGDFEAFNYVRVDAWNFASRPSGWYRIASVTGDKRANATFELREQADHSSVVFRVGCSFSDLNGTSVTILNHSHYGAAVFQQLRLLTNGAYDEMYLEAYIEPHIHDDEPFWAIINDNMRNGGWTLVNFIPGEIPAGYMETVYDIDELFVVAGSGDSESFRVDRDGNVGIGTASPVSKLDLGDNNSDPSDFPNKITLWSGGSNNYFGFGISSIDLDYFSQGNHRFYTEYNGTPGSEKMVIQANGDVGIGVPSPETKLHIEGNLSITNPEGYPYGSTIGSDSEGGWSREYSFTRPGMGGKLFSFGARCEADVLLYGYIGGNTNANTVHSDPWMVFDPNGNVGIDTTDPEAKLHIQQSNIGEATINASLVIENTDVALDLISSGGGNWGSGINLIEGNGATNQDVWSIYRTTGAIGASLRIKYGTDGNNPTSNETLVVIESDGNMSIDGTLNESAADYAEYFETRDGKAISVGTAVAVGKGGKIYPTGKGDIPIGIISGKPGILGNNPMEWPGKYLRDEFNQIIMEEYEEDELVPKLKKVRKNRGKNTDTEAGNTTSEVQREEVVRDKDGKPVMVKSRKKIKKRKLNPEYDETREYIPRKYRDEWCAVGLLGQLPLRKGQPVAPTWVKLYEISEKADMWLVK